MPSVSFSSSLKYRQHKGSGQAFVQVNRKRHYLGKFGTPESRRRYSRFVAELALAPPRHRRSPPQTSPSSPWSNCAPPTSTSRRRITSRMVGPPRILERSSAPSVRSASYTEAGFTRSRTLVISACLIVTRVVAAFIAVARNTFRAVALTAIFFVAIVVNVWVTIIRVWISIGFKIVTLYLVLNLPGIERASNLTTV